MDRTTSRPAGVGGYDALVTPWAVRLRAARLALFGGSLGWRDPTYLVSKPGEERALRFIAMILLLQRASYLVPTVATASSQASSTYRSPALNIVMLAAAVVWNVGLGVGIRRRGWFPHWTIGADVAIVCVLLLLGTMNTPADHVFTRLNWSTKLVFGTAALLGAALAPWPALLVGLIPVTTQLGALVVKFGTLKLPVDGVVGLLNSFFWFAVIAHFMRRYLCAQGRVLDETTQRQLAMEARRAAERARFAERIAQYRKLHDTVLTTLTAIARGGLDHRVDTVRGRCAADADYVRRLIREDASGTFTSLGSELADVIAAAENLGLRVHYLHDRLPAEVPREVVQAIAEASREALNNVQAHSGTTTAWLTATWDGDTLAVLIVDRGRGFEPDTLRPGFGIRSSITERMREIGGEADVFGMVDNGVCVELRWRAGQLE